MKTSNLVLALAAGIALPLGALAQTTGQSGQAGTSQYGTQSGTSQSGSDMGRSGSQYGTGQSDTRTGAEGSAAMPMFDTLDKNSDGFISKSEAKKSATANRNFRSLDTDRDGKLSHDEWQASGAQTGSQ